MSASFGFVRLAIVCFLVSGAGDSAFAQLDRSQTLPVDLLGKIPPPPDPKVRYSFMKPGKFPCSAHAERCIVPIIARTDFNYGVPKCTIEIPFDQLLVPKSKVKHKQIRVVFVVRNENSLDGNVYRFRPEAGVILLPGVILNPLPVPSSNDPARDFALVGMDTADVRRYAWASVNARRGLFPFEVYIQRHNPVDDVWDDCEPKDPIIFNTD